MAELMKFRAWITGFLPESPLMRDVYSISFAGYPVESISSISVLRKDNSDFIHVPFGCYELIRFTGKKGFNDRELYEGDIVFYEEKTDEGDERYYLVIVWIQEWSMFASLHLDEYKTYLEFGAKELDESMFWTYTLEESEHYHYAGNIFENVDLLNK